MAKKAHEFVKDGLQLDAETVDSRTERVSLGIVAAFIGGVLLICSFLAQFLFDNPAQADMLGAASAILLGAPLVFFAIKDLLQGHMHMNELVALAVIAAFATAKYQEAGAIAFFMILSVLIENRTALGAQASIESLVRITPTRAHLVEKGTECEVEARVLQPGNIVRVRPGDNIPADGRVTTGQSTVNQASITGESIPADKIVGDEVFGGTINLTGAMDIEVTKAGADTTLGRVKELILEAESTRIPIMRMIDRYAVWYTPTVLMLVFIVWFFTYNNATKGSTDSWTRVISMLVIACPCAIILATPTAMVAALSSAARLGVLIKSVVDLEVARNLSAMVFDKTGTLTTGELEITVLRPVDGVDGAELLATAAAIEKNSRHPVARAVTKVAQKARVDLAQTTEFTEVAGRGVTANVDGSRVMVGRADWLAGDGATLPASVVQQIRTSQSSDDAEGLSVLFVVRGDQLLGWIGLADNTRPQAAAAIDELKHLGLKRMIIVTGDRESVAKRVAAQMHTEYKAEVLPQQKLELVDDLKSRGHRVAVIGDGVNDAPALAAGDISIAMGAAGSEVAIQSASIALMNNNLNRIPFLIDLSRRTSIVMKQNLAIGVMFIVVFMSLAAIGVVSAITAAVLHLLSGLIVVFNSARLVRSGESIEYAEARLSKSGHPPASQESPPVQAQVAPA